MSRDGALQQLEERLGHCFADRGRLEQAVTHPSFAQAAGAGASQPNNQRLEFLGDAVLQLVLTEQLFALYPGEREGVLSRHRAALARGAFLAVLAREIGLDGCLRLGPSEEASGGRAKAGALEDAFEALVGAVYLDGGIAAAQAALRRVYGDLGERLRAIEPGDNPKGRLQERIQPTHGNEALRYEVIRAEGAAHARQWEVEVRLNERPLGRGCGPSKKVAEEAAARAALARLPQP